MESKLHLGPECTQESHVVDGLPPTPATCLPEGETGSEEELEKGEKASSSSSLPSVRTSKQCKYCALSWKQGFGAPGARCPWCHLCPGEAKTLKDVVAKRLNLAATLPPLALQFESEEARGSGSSFPEVLPLLTKSLPPVPPPTRSAPNFQEAQVPPAPCWDSEPKGLELETFGDEEVKLDDVLRVKSAVNASLPSVGSILHGTGTCKPCAWFWKPQGCRNGAECGHCHLCPVGESKNRRQAKMAAWRQGGPPLSGAATSLPPLALVPPVPEEPLWRPPPGLDLSPTVGLPPLPPVPPPVAPPPPAPASPAALLTGPALGSVGSAKHSTGECTLCPDAFTPEGCPKGPLCEKCHLCAAEFRAVSDVSGPEKDSAACILCGTNRCSCPRIHSGMACTEPDVVAVENPTDLPSLGSVLHAKGNCSPCAWVWKAQGCHNGRSCGRCHLCPPGEVKLRKKAKVLQKKMQAREARHGRKEYFCSSY